MKLLTIVVPCYNSQDYMEKCIESLRPTDERLDIVIIDDGSKDKTGEIGDALAAKYPTTVKVVHQPNGGHGEGINRGLKEARGKYFKTVDSDDMLSEDLPRFLELLEKCDADGGVDLFINDYRYIHADGKGDRTIDFSNALPEGRVFGWSDTRHFKIDQILMIHTCTFRTDLLRKGGVVLPMHTFYEDNYYVYANLANTEKLYYMHAPLYRYSIGREGQSVQLDVMKKRYMHQIKANELCFTSCKLSDIKNAKLRKYLKHELFIMCGIAILFARINETEESWNNLLESWERCRNYDAKLADHYRKHSALKFMFMPGKAGDRCADMIYDISHKVVRFN